MGVVTLIAAGLARNDEQAQPTHSMMWESVNTVTMQPNNTRRQINPTSLDM